MSESFKPPKGVQNAAKRGLELRKKWGRGGTRIGLKRANDLADGRPVSKDTLKRMKSFFARHEDNKNTDPKDGNGKIAHYLWGGDAGKRWAESKLKSLEESSTEKKTIKIKVRLKSEQTS